MEITYRKPVPEDAQVLLDFLKTVGGESGNLSFGAEGMPLSLEQEQKFLASAQNDPNSLMLLAMDGDEIVGNAKVSRSSRPRFRHRVSIALSVRKSHWHRGIGSALMEQMLSFAKNAGAEIAELEVRADNERAIGLYKKFGFVPFGTYPRFFKIDGEYFDAVYMTKTL